MPFRHGEDNPVWKADNVSYKSLHQYIRRHLSRPNICENCKSVTPYDVACINGIYDRNLENWRWWCRRCHMNIDGRANGLKTVNLIDMSDRVCADCGSSKTSRRGNRPDWRCKERPICKKCWMRRRRHSL